MRTSKIGRPRQGENDFIYSFAVATVLNSFGSSTAKSALAPNMES